MRDLHELARSQYGVIRPRDLDVLGIDRYARRMVLADLHRVSRGVYAIERPKAPCEVHRLRTVAALLNTKGSVASHVSAAVIHGLPIFRADLATVHLERGDKTRRGARSGLHLHRRQRATVRVQGIPTTSVADTIVDCARTQPRDTAVVMADFALNQGLTTYALLPEALEACGEARGISRARTVVQVADARAESVGETRTRLICIDAGLAVTPQVEVRDETGHVIARVDLGVDGLPLGIEFDGVGKYADYLDPDDAPDEKYWEEKVRNELIEDQGRILVPVYWNLLDLPRSLIARVHRGIERARKLAA